ncbi:MAG: hypothetical protein GX801_06840 [Fibrobacter sp.]|nr:hypothetical protein [Fibrobacter sp.]
MIQRIPLVFSFGFVLGMCFKLFAAEVEIYVSPVGNDYGKGTLESPFKTISRAQKEVRQYNSNEAQDITVYLRGGTY